MMPRSRLQKMFGRSEQNGVSQAQQNERHHPLENAPSDDRQYTGKDLGIEGVRDTSRTLETEAKIQGQDRTEIDTDLASSKQDKTLPEKAENPPSEQDAPQGREAVHNVKDGGKGGHAKADVKEAVHERETQENFFKELEERVEQITQDRPRSRGERTR